MDTAASLYSKSKLLLTRSCSSPELSRKLSSVIPSAVDCSVVCGDMPTPVDGERKNSSDDAEEIARLVRQDTSPVSPEDGAARTSSVPSVTRMSSQRSVSRKVSESSRRSCCCDRNVSTSRSDTNNNSNNSSNKNHADDETMDTSPPLDATSNPESGKGLSDVDIGAVVPCPPVYMQPGPGSPIEIAFSFDTTGSMSQCLDEVRARVQEIITRLFGDIPNLRIAIFAHGDYCDAEMYGYVTKFVDFTTDQAALCQFVRDVGGTGGGDFEECYELVLKQACDSLSWTAGTHRSLVMIGDAIPHPVSDDQPIDWRKQVEKLHKEKGVRVYGVQCMNERGAGEFFSELADQTGGRHIKLDSFTTIIDIIMAICYREHRPEHLEAYEREVRQREGRGIRRELSDVFDALRHNEASQPTEGCQGVATSSGDIGELKTQGVAKKQRNSAKNSTTTTKPKHAKELTTKYKKNKRSLARKVPKRQHNAKQHRIKPQFKRRELIPETRFLLNAKKWSRWENVMTGSNNSCDLKQWTHVTDDRRHFRKNHIFNKNTEKPALYEFGIQTGFRKRIGACFVKATRGFPSRYSGFWERYLLSTDHVRRELARCVRGGVRLFVRRCIMTSPMSSATLLRKTYDYAWNKPCERQYIR